MLTKYRDVRPQKDVRGPLKNVFMSAAHSEFFSGKGPNFHTFSSVFFPEELFLSVLRIKKAVGGPGACSPRKV